MKHAKITLRSFFYLFFLGCILKGQSQTMEKDSSGVLVLSGVEISLQTFNLQAKTPAYPELIEGYSRKKVLQLSEDYRLDDSSNFSSNYAGFKISFTFQGSLLENVRFIDLFSLGVETGVHQINLFNLVLTDSSNLLYKMDNQVFRLALGAKKYFTKKNKRFMFYTGLDWSHEFHVSSLLFEGDRKLFAQKRYSTYLSIPLGIEYRFSGKKTDFKRHRSLFFSINSGLGLQNVDPYRFVGGFTGSSLGLIFSI